MQYKRIQENERESPPGCANVRLVRAALHHRRRRWHSSASDAPLTSKFANLRGTSKQKRKREREKLQRARTLDALFQLREFFRGRGIGGTEFDATTILFSFAPRSSFRLSRDDAKSNSDYIAAGRIRRFRSRGKFTLGYVWWKFLRLWIAFGKWMGVTKRAVKCAWYHVISRCKQIDLCESKWDCVILNGETSDVCDAEKFHGSLSVPVGVNERI